MPNGVPTFPQLAPFSSLELGARAASQFDGARVINLCMRKVVTENEPLVGKVVTAHSHALDIATGVPKAVDNSSPSTTRPSTGTRAMGLTGLCVLC